MCRPCRLSVSTVSETVKETGERQLDPDTYKSLRRSGCNCTLEHFHPLVSAFFVPLVSRCHFGVESVQPLPPPSQQLNVILRGKMRFSGHRTPLYAIRTGPDRITPELRRGRPGQKPSPHSPVRRRCRFLSSRER